MEITENDILPPAVKAKVKKIADCKFFNEEVFIAKMYVLIEDTYLIGFETGRQSTQLDKMEKQNVATVD